MMVLIPVYGSCMVQLGGHSKEIHPREFKPALNDFRKRRNLQLQFFRTNPADFPHELADDCDVVILGSTATAAAITPWRRTSPASSPKNAAKLQQSDFWAVWCDEVIDGTPEMMRTPGDGNVLSASVWDWTGGSSWKQWLYKCNLSVALQLQIERTS